jgi:hypothetical protein
MDSELQRELDLAGMPSAMRGSVLTTNTVMAPHHVEISNGSLVYDPRDCEMKTLRRGGRLLESFTDLWRKGDGEILSFSIRHGVLELDAAAGYLPAQDRKMHAAVWGKGEFPKTGREPLEIWRRYSRRFSALLAISAKLHQGEPGAANEWKVFAPNYGAAFDVSDQELLVEQTIGEFVLQSNLRPVLNWSMEPNIVFGTLDCGGLYASLLFHLMLAITKRDGLAICGSCQRSFTPAAKARRGNIRFCDDCRKNGSAHRVAARNYLNRKNQTLGKGRHGKKAR